MPLRDRILRTLTVELAVLALVLGLMAWTMDREPWPELKGPRMVRECDYTSWRHLEDLRDGD